jgi:uncharacterized LabA/DUF88 family protein
VSRDPRRANVYIDGFNLYYAIRKRFQDCKWLDVRQLSETLFPAESVQRVRYFTAKVSARPHDLTQPQRQQAYLRALEAVGVELHYGSFKQKRVPMWRAAPCIMPDCAESQVVSVIKSEEKGSDVALGAYLLRDSYVGDMDLAVVITNDTDLVTPLQIARDEVGMTIALVSPYKLAHRDLEANADVVKKLRRKPVAGSLLPWTMRDEKGEIHCPEAWRPRKREGPA